MERKHVRIEYRVRPDVDLEELERDITAFVDGIRAHRESNLYTSYRDTADPRHFVHIGEFDAEQVAGLQQQDFFKRFATRLRERCAVPPEVTTLSVVRSTRQSR